MCIRDSCNTVPGYLKSSFLPVWALFGSYKAYFRQVGIHHLFMHTLHSIHKLPTDTITRMLMCTLVHIVDVGATLLNFVLIDYIM